MTTRAALARFPEGAGGRRKVWRGDDVEEEGILGKDWMKGRGLEKEEEGTETDNRQTHRDDGQYGDDELGKSG